MNDERLSRVWIQPVHPDWHPPFPVQKTPPVIWQDLAPISWRASRATRSRGVTVISSRSTTN